MKEEVITVKARNLYDIVAGLVYNFCDETYYFSTCIVRFEQSYDGLVWTEETEIAFFEKDDGFVFDTDWCEGQTYIRNLQICHLDEVRFPNEVTK